jgi:hypothetical protein
MTYRYLRPRYFSVLCMGTSVLILLVAQVAATAHRETDRWAALCLALVLLSFFHGVAPVAFPRHLECAGHRCIWAAARAIHDHANDPFRTTHP